MKLKRLPKYAATFPQYAGKVVWVHRRWYHRFTTTWFTDDPSEERWYWTPYSW